MTIEEVIVLWRPRSIACTVDLNDGLTAAGSSLARMPEQS
jgi:hypothetical protein